jgi:glutathione reductase (NADPH)
MSHDFDLLVLGAGSGGVAASRRAALHGARVAVVEGGRVGGTCVIRGCVPKKLLMYAAQFSDAFREARGYGWSLDESPPFEMARWQQAKASEIDRLENIYRKMLAGAGVELIEGWASFDGPQAVRIRQATGERVVTAQHILIATGGSPATDTLPGIEHCATSDDLLDMDSLPGEVAVIGAGYIAVEFTSMLARLGVKVALYYRNRLPLRGFDEMLRIAAVAELQACGVELHPGNMPQRVQRSGDADNSLLLSFTEDRVREFPWVLNATGRRPNTAQLELQRAGVTTDEDGAVIVDPSTLQTATAGIHAIGDVTGLKNLTPVAIAQGRALADTLFGRVPRTVDLSLVASAVFMLPPMASVGPAEDEALAALQPGQRIHIFETDFRPMKQAFIGSEHRTRMKLLVSAETDRVLAVHMAGHDAPEIVQSLAVALTAGATKAHFDRTIAMHPTAAEEFVLMREPARTIGA